MIRKYLVVPAVSLLCIISSISFATAASPQQEPATYVANFDYTPDTQAAPGSAGVTFATVKVAYKSDPKVLWITFPQFANLDKAIEQDLPELLTAKGVSVRGPFDSYDLIPFSDKKDIDLLLVPTLELSVTLKDKKEKVMESTWTGQPRVFNLTGNAEISGKMNLELRETVTRELMWAKSIPFAYTFSYSQRIPSRVEGEEVETHYVKGVPVNNALIMDDVAKGMEKEYPNLMTTISKLIDPEEMKVIKKQCQELKGKRGY